MGNQEKRSLIPRKDFINYLCWSGVAVTALFILPKNESAAPYSNVYSPQELNLSQTTKELVDIFGNNIGTGSYNLRDSEGIGMDVLNIEKINEDNFLGVSHHNENGVFHIRLSQSNDLVHWNFLSDIGAHLSMGKIKKLADDSYLLLSEIDDGHKSQLNLKHYKDLNSLIENNSFLDLDIPRTLSQSHEGTPNIFQVEYKDHLHFSLMLGFHYNDTNTDKEAKGTLEINNNHFKWNAQSDIEANTNMGTLGNIGGRSNFTYKGREYTIYERQLAKDDFGSWSLVLYDKELDKYVFLPVRTLNGSRSIANPNVLVTENKIIITAFIFNENSAPGEAGTIIAYQNLQT